MEKYGVSWPAPYSDLDIELFMVKSGGLFKGHGKGLEFHHGQAARMIWPELEEHKWSVLIRKELCRPGAKVTCLMGPGSTAKTHEASKWGLIEYFADPENTCVLVSSTDIRGLKLRVWAEISMLWQKAIDLQPDLPGHMLESRIAITTDSLEDGELGDRNIRDMRKAINGIPCVQDKKFVGLAKYHGIKQKRMRLIGDELSMMGVSFLKSFANLNNNEDFQAVLCFNPNDPLDPGGQAAEPKEGWMSHIEPAKTEAWDTKFMNGRCVNLIGTDSPNFDDPHKPNRYPFLIGPRKIAEVISGFGKDSFEYFSQCVGAMKVATLSRRVITRELCEQFHAKDQVIWADNNRTRLAALDAAYGGDRAVLIRGDMGRDIKGNTVLALYSPVVVPLSVKTKEPMVAEDQISNFCKDYCQSNGIAPENFAHDSTGRGSLGTSLARLWSAQCVPVEFGGSPTQRPVSLDHWVYDQDKRVKRLKRCDEHYSKLVSELWFSVRYAIEAGQIRGLADDVLEEGCLREWNKVKNDKLEVESKQDMKERIGRSPDLFDALAILVEVARRRGFQISKLANDEDEDQSSQWLRNLAQRQAGVRSRHSLTYS